MSGSVVGLCVSLGGYWFVICDCVNSEVSYDMCIWERSCVWREVVVPVCVWHYDYGGALWVFLDC